MTGEPTEVAQATAVQEPTDEDDDDYLTITIKLPTPLNAAFGLALVGMAVLAGYLIVSAVGQLRAPYRAVLPPGLLAVPTPLPPTPLPARLDGVSLDDDPFLGPEDAPVSIVEFSDYLSVYTRRFHDETLGALLERYGEQIRYVYRDFPVVGGQQAAEAAECADEQGRFWAMHDLILSNQPSGIEQDAWRGFARELDLDMPRFDECLSSGKYADEVLADLQAGRSYGVYGTPTFFINGVRVVGAQPLEVFQEIIDQELSPP